MENRDELLEAYAENIVEGMSFKDLWAYALENLQDSLATYSDEQLLDEITEFAPHLLGE